MKTIKCFTVVLFLLCITGFTNAQEILFAVGDTTETITVPEYAKTGFITVSDSSVAGTDSISAVAKTGSVLVKYSPFAVHDINAVLQATYIASVMIPGDGLTKTYSFEIGDLPDKQFVIYRANAVSQAGRCRIILSWK